MVLGVAGGNGLEHIRQDKYRTVHGVFDGLDEVYHQMDEDSLLTKMQEIGYKDILQARIPLPNGKAFVRMDFLKGKRIE